MKSWVSRVSMRGYLLVAVLPLSLGPLFLLAVLLNFVIQTSFDDEIGRRAKPEMVALARNLENLEKNMHHQTFTMAKSDKFKLAALTQSFDDLESQLKSWMLPSLFDEVRVFSYRGVELQNYRRQNMSRLSTAWRTLYALPKNRQGRSPSSESTPFKQEDEFAQQNERRGSTTLKPDFRRFISKQGHWIVRELVEHKGEPQFAVTAYRSIYDSDFKLAAILEARIFMNSFKWQHLAKFQAVDFALISEDRNSIGVSHPSLDGVMSEALKNWRALELSSQTFLPSKRVDAGELALNFFFTPLLQVQGENKVWLGLGLSRQSQVFVQNRILIWVVAVTILLAIVSVSLALFLSQRLTTPIQDLVDAAEGVKEGKPVVELVTEASATKEISFLIDRFNEMAMSVQAAKRTLEQKLEELANSNIQLTQAQDQLVESAKMSSLGQLVAGVAHELNNPIAFIYSNMIQMRQYLNDLSQLTQLMEETKDKLPEDERRRLEALLQEIEWDFVQEDMDDIVRSCLEGSVRVKDIVLGLRNFSRMDKGQVGEADLNVALQNTAKLLSGQAKNRVEIDWELCDDAFVRCNVSQINQVFMNLMANAIQAIDHEGLMLIQTENIDRAGVDFLRIRIRDNGLGMSQETVSKIFDPFFTTKGVGEGTGLGLSIVYGIVQKHGGFIDVQSQLFPDPMHGSTFDVYLPKSGPPVDTDLEQAS